MMKEKSFPTPDLFCHLNLLFQLRPFARWIIGTANTLKKLGSGSHLLLSRGGTHLLLIVVAINSK
jgi:hypothetical protein